MVGCPSQVQCAIFAYDIVCRLKKSQCTEDHLAIGFHTMATLKVTNNLHGLSVEAVCSHVPTSRAETTPQD